MNHRTEFKTRNYLLPFPLLFIGLIMLTASCMPEEGNRQVTEPEEVLVETITEPNNEVFDVVENMPTPAGGMEGWNQYLGENLRYPSAAKTKGIEGTVYVAFTVKDDGSVSDVEILRGIGGGCDEEALKVIKNSPRWEPGTQRDKKVNVKMRVPIRFALGS
ncbi:MAG TPA: energy transducer TonB [Cyclobacteriaceae bacterium]|nr:energy transducer TonB [Cyclobacteriaceae bacterium]